MRARLLSRLLCAAAAVTLSYGTSCATTEEKGGDAGPREAPREAWRDARPPSGTVTPVAPYAFQHAELKNGLSVIVLEDHALPLVHATLVVRAGVAHEGKEHGTAQLTWPLLHAGAGDYGAAGLAQALGDVGAVVDTDVEHDYGQLRVRVPRDGLDKAMELLSLMAQKPSFQAGDFERARAAYRAASAHSHTDAAHEALFAEMYGDDHPYGRRHTPAATLDKLKPASMKKFWTEHAGPKNAALIFTGDITLDVAKSIADKHFGKWKGGPAKAKPPVMPKPKKQPKLIGIDVPGAATVDIAIGRAVNVVSDADVAAARVISQLTSDMPGSRFAALKDEKLIALSSSLWPHAGPSPFIIQATAAKEKVGDVVSEVVATLDTLKTGGITDEELGLAKAGIARAQPALALTEAARAFALSQPYDHQQRLSAAMATVTTDAAKAAANRMINLDDLVIVLVGDRASLEAAMQNRGVGELIFTK